MNKNIILLIVIVVIIGAGFLFRTVFLKGSICTAEQGEEVVIEVRSLEGAWVFDPANITINRCDKVTMNIFNEDDYDHGIAIDVFGVNKRLNPNTNTTIKFTASKTGQFLFYCSVPCGEGHFRHSGDIEVIDFIEQTN